MSNKIIRLESLSLMDHDDDRNDGGIFQTTRLIEVGHPYDEPHFKTVYDGSYRKLVERHSDRDVVSIYFIRDPSDSDENCYMVRLKNGNELRLPMHAFIAESKEVTDDEQ
ncbi:hypothetical protein [Lacticaseibacillus paracasei]|uniref:hypothetical protein n=1 Tax=Lacticaseibacillus paracasei TaxID=1597 RepID=UPI0025A30BE9|nr:hypothetical protein [Lacticaseibacillus paracasei]MDM7527175.1 hypothetical protein [Lacticaseibacillus paracasei]